MKANFTLEQVEEALSTTVDDLDKEDEAEALEISRGEGVGKLEMQDFDDEGSNVGASINLANIPTDAWDSLSVSPRSKFCDATWDFSDYPSSDPVGGSRVVLRSKDRDSAYVDSSGTFNRIWYDIRRALVFYTIPHFSSISRIQSYASVSSVCSRTKYLMAFLKEQNLYIGLPDSNGHRTINDVSAETLTAHIEKLETHSMRWALAWSITAWQKLSSSGLLPKAYSLYSALVKKSELSDVRKAFDDSANPFDPIPLDDYAKILTHASRWVRDLSKDVLWLQRTYLSAIVEGSIVPIPPSLLIDSVDVNSPAAVELFRRYQPLTINGEPWWNLDPTMPKQFVINVTSELAYACYTIILATTGMRSSEIHNLKVGCISKGDDGYSLTFEVYKTSFASQGDTKTIPVPELTAISVTVLEELGSAARLHGKHNFLCVVTKGRYFGSIVHAKHFAHAVLTFARRAGVDEGIHPHRFRKSLAMYIIYSDPTALEVIKWLFSHKSLKMTLRYILELPGVAKEIKKFLVEQNATLLAEVVHASLNKRVGGIGGKRVQSTLESSPLFLAKLQDDGKETLRQYVDSVLEQGLQLLHRTNMAICLKSPALNSESPCVGKNESAVSKLHPNLYACDPLECQHAAFTLSNVSALQAEIQFHHRFSEHKYASPEQQRFSLKRIKLAFDRLKEVSGSDADDFMLKVANG
jgi:hypothetical protein